MKLTQRDANRISIGERIPPVPAGCFRYHFNEKGEYYRNKSKLTKHGTYYTCIASNESNATRKFCRFAGKTLLPVKRSKAKTVANQQPKYKKNKQKDG